MKYKIISVKKKDSKEIIRKKHYILKGYGKLPKLQPTTCTKRELPVECGTLFEFGSLYDPYSPSYSEKKKKRFANGGARLRKLKTHIIRALVILRKKAARTAALASHTAQRVTDKIRKKREMRPPRPSLLPALSGALCASLLIAALSFGTVVYSLFIRDRLGRYELVSIPDFVGSSYPDSDIFGAHDYCNFKLEYEYSSTLPEGTVISQSPPANVTRRVYRDRSLCNVTLKVSIGERTFTMNDYSSSPLREAVLELKNEAVRFTVTESYSDTVEAGHIISTEPATGEIFSAQRTVILCVSKGRRTVFVTVPSLIGLTEQRAEELLRASSLSIGKVTYLQSGLPSGTVISQSHEAYSELEEGTAVSFTVSAGIKYNEKTVPDLYGLTLEEARARLAEYGLVEGRIYKVGSGAREGTVVAQSPLPETPITSGLVSVDIYISS